MRSSRSRTVFDPETSVNRGPIGPGKEVDPQAVKRPAAWATWHSAARHSESWRPPGDSLSPADYALGGAVSAPHANDAAAGAFFQARTLPRAAMAILRHGRWAMLLF